MCGQSAYARTSPYLITTTKARYNQCTNLHRGHTFSAHDTFTRSVYVPQQIEPVTSHPDHNSQNLLQFD
ncbi:ogr/Delta-like zinc finger family protein [Sodalis endosymbiont of Spalangia cameroni]|uniref:ogr/Delta-like zinc finger family protein n=1 Tax=Sodalis praecaptivus TaxID=1239307 RepID=UPI0031F90E79